MEYSELLQRIQEDIKNPPKTLLFIAGYLQIKTLLDSDFLFEMLSNIYSSGFEPQYLRLIESHLMNCNLAEVKNLLSTQDRCLLCKKISGDLVYLECIHSFHRECLLDFFFSELEKTISISCPTCNLDIQNFQVIDPRIQVLYLEKIKQKLGNSKINIIFCQSCGEPFDSDSQVPQNCYTCKKLIR